MAELVGKKVLWARCKRVDRALVLDSRQSRGHRSRHLQGYDGESFQQDDPQAQTVMITSGGRVQRLSRDVDLAAGGLMVEATQLISTQPVAVNDNEQGDPEAEQDDVDFDVLRD